MFPDPRLEFTGTSDATHPSLPTTPSTLRQQGFCMVLQELVTIRSLLFHLNPIACSTLHTLPPFHHFSALPDRLRFGHPQTFPEADESLQTFPLSKVNTTPTQRRVPLASHPTSTLTLRLPPHLPPLAPSETARSFRTLRRNGSWSSNPSTASPPAPCAGSAPPPRSPATARRRPRPRSSRRRRRPVPWIGGGGRGRLVEELEKNTTCKEVI